MNLRSTLEKLYPTGSYGGQCGTFAHKLVEFPSIGNSLNAKIASVKKLGILISDLDSFKLGDIVVTSESMVFGHVAYVNAFIGGKLQLTESNFKWNFRVSHDRLFSPISREIVGVIRGKQLFKWPDVNYPIQLTCTILMNGQPFWNSLLQHMANLQNWFWQASNQRVQLIIDYKNTNLTNWETVFTGPVMGGSNVEIIKEQWYDQHILPLTKSDIVIFNMPRAAWHGTVFDHPDQIELGYCYEKVGMSKPIKIFTVSDEHDDYAPYYPKLAAYAKLAAHEILHGFYGVAAGDNVIPGGDYTHNHFLGINGRRMEPADCFDEIDYSKLI